MVRLRERISRLIAGARRSLFGSGGFKVIIDFIRNRRRPVIHGVIGLPLKEFQETGFFRWFAFEECPAEPARSEGVQRPAVVFRPEGESFHNHVSLVATLQGERIKRLELDLEPAMSVARRFPFALDCAKSFLTAATASDGRATGRVGRLVAALEAMMEAQGVHAPSHSVANQAEDEGRVLKAVKVFAGLADACELEEDGLRISISGRSEQAPGGRYALRVRIARADRRWAI